MALPRGLGELGVADAASLEPDDCSPTEGVAWTADIPWREPDGIVAVEPDDMPIRLPDPIALDRGLGELGLADDEPLEPADCSDCDGVACTEDCVPAVGAELILPDESEPCPPEPDRGLEELGVGEPALLDPADCSDCDGVA